MKLIIDQTRQITHPSPEQIAASLAAFDEFVVLELEDEEHFLQTLEERPGQLLVEHVTPDAHRTLGLVPREAAVGLFQAAARGDRAWREDPRWGEEHRASQQPALADGQQPFNLAQARKLFLIVFVVVTGFSIFGFAVPAFTNPRQRELLLRDLPRMAVAVVGAAIGFALLIVFYQAMFSAGRPAIARWLSGVLGVTVVQRGQSPRHRSTLRQRMSWVVREQGTGKDWLVALLDIAIMLMIAMVPFALLALLLLYLGSR